MFKLRSRLRRHTPLRSRGYIRRKRPMARRRNPIRQRSPKRRGTSPEDRERLAWLHEQRCCAPGHEDCRQRVIVHHDTHDRGLGQKSLHARGMPLCWRAHRDFHDSAGPFRGWTRERRREWQDEMVERFQAAWERESGPRESGIAMLATNKSLR